MSRRTERVASMIKNALGKMLLRKLSDPRVDPARTSILRVEVQDDLLLATVYISVIGSDADQRKAVTALNGAAGHFQELLGRQITLRNTPRLKFTADEKYKKTMHTLEIIREAMDEIREKEVVSSSQTQVDDDKNTPSLTKDTDGKNDVFLSSSSQLQDDDKNTPSLKKDTADKEDVLVNPDDREESR